MAIRTALAAAALLSLGACSGPAEPELDPNDRFAGLDAEIRAWRADILAQRPDCADAPKDKACRAFEVACKGERDLSGEDQAAGAVARVVSAMTFESWDAARSEFRPSSAFAEFRRGPEGWVRADTGPVNLSTCVGG